MLGDKIRETRKNLSLTLNQLAQNSGYTASYISQIERGLVDPSISSLRKIASALRVPMYSFLNDDEQDVTVIRVNQRKKLILPDSNVVYEYLSPMSNNTEQMNMEIIQLKIDGKSWSRDDYSIHSNAEECILVLSGSVTIDLNDEKHDLYEGDSIYIRMNTPHRAYNPNNSPSIVLLCITPPVY